MTDYCGESAARDAYQRDYFLVFIVDATGNPGIGDKEQIRTIVGRCLKG
jgi:nicotinamidase-related amidase